MSELIGNHVGGELKNCIDEDVKIVVDIIVIGKDDPLAVVPTKTEFVPIHEDAQDIKLGRACGHDKPCIVGSLRYDLFDTCGIDRFGVVLKVGSDFDKSENLP